MGCVFSRQEYDDDPRIFHVWNVDSEGRTQKPGRIEVTSSHLLLYQKEAMVRWPLTSLRRYGFDSEVFSFECGRRCATGAGVYAFRCRRAQALFAALQESINNSTAVQPTPPQPPQTTTATTGSSSPMAEDADGYLEPVVRSNNNGGAGTPGRYVCLEEGEGPEWPQYENGECLAAPPCVAAEDCCRHCAVKKNSCVDYNTNYAKLDDLLKQERKKHFYVNVKPEDAPSSSPDGSDPPQMNYVVLDLHHGGAPDPPATPAHSPEGYAQIDFDKTVALSNSANPCADFNDDSIRKTRHNAVIPSSCASTSSSV